MLNQQRSIKRIIDIFFALIAIIFLLPLILITALLVSLSLKGSIFFLQERIGFNQKPFLIWKFRSMHNTEEAKMQRGNNEVGQVTHWGKIMRMWRLDELPQFWNVLKGDMSLVGPRPERKFYIDQIIKSNPEYLNLLKVKPGLTSAGMVKFGYAVNVDEMIERMKYDLDYFKKKSLLTDFKIMLQSIKVIFSGKGK